jgi:hypothetical protein
LSRTFILNEKAIGSLLKFAVEYDYMTEQIWHQLLKILNALDTAIDGQDGGKEQKSYKFTHWVENSPYFARFIEKFLQFSMGKFNIISSTVNIKDFSNIQFIFSAQLTVQLSKMCLVALF